MKLTPSLRLIPLRIEGRFSTVCGGNTWEYSPLSEAHFSGFGFAE
jgi:hypothetical protein